MRRRITAAALGLALALVVPSAGPGRQAERALEGLQPDAQQGPLHRPDPHAHTAAARLEGLRAGDLQPNPQPAHRPAVHVRVRRVRGDRLHADHRPVRNAVRPTPAHWAPEWAAIDEVPASYAVRPLVVINTAPQVAGGPEVLPLRRRREEVGDERHRQDPGRLGGDGALGLVQAVDDRPGEGAGAGGRARTSRASSLDALKFFHLKRAHPVPRARAARHGLDADARG